MRENTIVQALNQFRVGEYTTALRESGRLLLPREKRAEAVGVYQTVRQLRDASPVLSQEVRLMVDLAERFLSGEWFIWNREFVNYPNYISDPILREALGATRRDPLPRFWARCWSVLRTLTSSLLSFEISSLAHINPWYPLNQVDSVLRERIKLLLELKALLSPETKTPSFNVFFEDPPDDWLSYATDRRQQLALLFLTTFPVTREHDEFLFVRVLQMTECCFWGTLTAVMGAVEMGKRDDVDRMRSCLAAALRFSNFLMPITNILKTMPREHFWAFRDATDGSSAIQSRSFHLLQIYTIGFDEGKAPILSKIPEVRDLLHYGVSNFVTLQAVLRRLRDQNVSGFKDLEELAVKLDRALYAYRCLHLGVVHHYLPPDAKRGTGGTGGVPYLRRHLLRRIWPLDTQHVEPSWEEIEALGAARPVIGLVS